MPGKQVNTGLAGATRRNVGSAIEQPADEKPLQRSARCLMFAAMKHLGTHFICHRWCDVAPARGPLWCRERGLIKA
jgi:hypothetical protein